MPARIWTKLREWLAKEPPRSPRDSVSTDLSRVSRDFVARLTYDVQVDPDYLLERNLVVRHIRIMADVSFETHGGWTETETAIIDTGGLISIIPRRIWQEVRYSLYSDTEYDILIGGTSAVGKFGQVVLRCHDAENGEQISPSQIIKAGLLSDDAHPIVLGFEDFLTDVALYSNFPQREVHLSFPNLSPE